MAIWYINCTLNIVYVMCIDISSANKRDEVVLVFTTYNTTQINMSENVYIEAKVRHKVLVIFQ